MNDALKGVVVSHGTVATALVDAVRSITGDADALVAISNEGCSRDSLGSLVAEAAGDGDCVLFVDLPGGSCLQAAMVFQRARPAIAIAVVAGVNLAMLLDFVQHRDTSLAEAAARAAAVGASTIKVVGS